MKKTILTILLILLCIAGAYCAIYFPDSNINNTISEAQNLVIEEIQNEVAVSDETKDIANNTKEATENNEDISTTEIIKSSEEEEKEITDEGALENDAVIEQENISYNGVSTGNGLSLLGSYQGLTYYSQADSRWASVMYSSIGDYSQTMKSSACGPTSAAIVVSSSKGAILPTTMASLFVSNGYRTASNGTAWSAYSFVADYFDFKEYHTTSNFDTAMSYLRQKDENGNSKYYIIASCGSGLFTTGGHYIVLVGNNDGTITVYDPYLYSGKFNTASRRNAGVVVSGNSVYVSENSFKTYANYKNFWIYSNDNGSGNTNTTINNTNIVNYTRYVATQSLNLNVRSGPGTNYSKISSLAKGTTVTVTEINGDWSKISSPVQGWVSSSYLSSTAVTTTSFGTSYSTTVGAYYRLKGTTILYSNSNLTGTRYNYLAKTQIRVISHASATVDYIYCVKTGRYAYCTVSAYCSTTSQNCSNTGQNSTVGQYKRLKNRTYLYSNSSLSGTRYTYLDLTQVRIIRNVSSTVDYVYVVKTR